MKALIYQLLLVHASFLPMAYIIASILSFLGILYFLIEIRSIRKYKRSQKMIHFQLHELSIRIDNADRELKSLRQCIENEMDAKQVSKIAEARSLRKYALDMSNNEKMKWQKIAYLMEDQLGPKMEMEFEKDFLKLSNLEAQHFVLHSKGYSQKEISTILDIPQKRLLLYWFKICQKLHFKTDGFHVELCRN